MYDGAGVERWRTSSEFDNYTPDTTHATLTNRSSISGLDASFTTAYVSRGNVTVASGYLLNTAGQVTGSVTSYLQYDIAGNVVKAIDARGCGTNFDFTDRFGSPDADARLNSAPLELSSPGQASYGFATQITNCMNHTTYNQFEYYLGRPVDAEDANGVATSSYAENEPLDRPTRVILAANKDASVKTQIVFSYNDDAHIVTTTSDQNTLADGLRVKATAYDGLGRTKEIREYEGGANYIAVQTEYDGLGRPYRTSSPFRPLQNESPAWTTMVFDGLSRILSTTTTPDNAAVSRSYNGCATTVTDQTGKARKSVTDSLGRVSEVYEAPNGLNYQTRNLTLKTDARGVVTENRYDALDRLTTVLYRINGQPDPNTGDIEYLYDSAANGKGRMWLTYRWGAKPSHTTVGEYDAAGRVKQLWNDSGDGQGGWLPGYGISRNYNLAGQVTSQTYPSGHTGNYVYDTAGRTSSFTGNLGDGVTRSYASSFVYNARSQVTQELFGTAVPLYHKLQYNIRGQLWDVRVSTNPDVNGSSNRGGLQFFYDSSLGYGTSGPDNNGNVVFANTYTPEDEQSLHWAMTRQSYNYDSLNRLKSVTEYFANYSHPESQQSVQTYDYDRWGNRTINAAQTSGAGINNTAFEVEAARNRLYSPGDLALSDSQRRIRYDQAGNQTKDTYTGYGTATFDGDNHIVAIHDKFVNSSTYTYNANGQRVRRKINNQETWQIYGIDGELVAEYAANAAVGTPQKEYGYRDGELLVTASVPSRVNFASSTNGATATAQNYTQDGVFAGYHFYPPSTIDGQRYGHLIAGGGDINGFWRDEHGLPSWLEVNFNGSKTIDEIDVFTLPECPTCLNQADPSPTQTFSQYGVTGFEVQYWTGSSWATVPGGSISSNNLVWRKVSFAAITTSKIRVMVTAAATDRVARIAEIEAWGSSSVATNVALSTNGATATAQNYTQDGVFAGYHFYPSSAIDAQRYGHLIAGGGDINGFWRDEHGLPSWLEVNFNGSKTIEEIDVFTLPECPTCLNQADPSPTQTFSQYGVTGFEVQYWTGSSWATVPGGSISSNNLVWRKLTFAGITTSKIRVMVTAAATDGVARIAEVEAWTTSPNNNTTINWLVPDHLGTPRIILDQTGSFANLKRHDYLPFGEELPAGTGGRTAAMGYVAGEGVRQQFTSQERDVETGLDYFGARYLSPIQGRFGSVDPLMQSAGLEDPQSFNRYSYVLNNPVNLDDPDGMCPKGRKCYHDDKGYEYYDDDEGNPVTVTNSSAIRPTVSVIALTTVVASPYQIIFRSTRVLYSGAPRATPAMAPRGLGVFGKLFGAIGIILSSPTSAGCGQTRVEMVSDGNGGCVPVMSDEEQPDTSANPDPEDNKPDTTENKKTEKDKKASSKEKPARDLISGGEKRSKSYHSELEDKTPSELEKLAKQGGVEGHRAKKMLKLINERPRLQNRRKK